MARKPWTPSDEQRRFLKALAKCGQDGMGAGWDKPTGVAAQLVRAGLVTYEAPYQQQRNLWRLGRFYLKQNKRSGTGACMPDEHWKFRRSLLMFVVMNAHVGAR